MPKNVVLCCDGTADEFARDRTNVVKLYFTLDPNPARQVTYYHPGLGTMEPPGALSGVTRVFTRFAARAFGYGLEADIRDAYIFLMNNFEEGDRVFLFGFSRGAYTARAVASLLRMYGLIPRGNDALVPYAVRLLMGIYAIDSSGRHRCAEENAISISPPTSRARLRRGFASHGLSGVGHGEFDRLVRKSAAAAFYGRQSRDRNGRHAIAIDERRAFFRTNLWIPKGPPPHSGPATSNRFGFRVFTVTWAAAIRSGRAASPSSRCAGCSWRRSMPAFSSSLDAWISCSAGAAPTPSQMLMPKCTSLWPASGGWPRFYGSATTIGPTKVGAPLQPGPTTDHPAKLAHPRIGLSARRRLCAASAPRCYTDKLIAVFAASLPFAASVMLCELSHSITVGLRGIIGPKTGSFGHWQLSAGETCSP